MKEIIDFPTSTTARRVSYLSDTGELEVYFVNGHIYVYTGVPTEVFARAKNATSIGKFLNAEVIDKFSFRKTK